MIQRITSNKQRQKLRSKAKLHKMFIMNKKWRDEQAIISHIDKKVSTLEDIKEELKEMAKIIIQIKETL